MRLDGEEFHGRQVERRKFRDFIFVQRYKLRTIRPVDVLTRWCIRVGIRIQIEFVVRRILNRVKSIFFRQARQPRAIDRNTIKVPFERRLFRGAEVDHTFRFIQRQHAADFPIAMRH